MDMKTPLDADKIKSLIDAAASERVASIHRLANDLKAEVDEYIRNAEFVQTNVGQLFADAVFFAVKEVALDDDFGYRRDEKTWGIGGVGLQLEGNHGHLNRTFPIRASHHSSGEREEIIEVPKGRYRVIVALMPVVPGRDGDGV